jgi:hypothetical protein
MNMEEDKCDNFSKRQATAVPDTACKQPGDSQATAPVFGSAASRRRKLHAPVSKKLHKLFGRDVSSPGGTPGFPVGPVSSNFSKASIEVPFQDPIFDYSRSSNVESDSHAKAMEAEADRKALKRAETNRAELLDLKQANAELQNKSRSEKQDEVRIEAVAAVAHNNLDLSATTTSASTILSDTDRYLQAYKSPTPRFQSPLDTTTSKMTEEHPHDESLPPSPGKVEAGIDDEQQETGLGQSEASGQPEQIKIPDQPHVTYVPMEIGQSQVSAQLAPLDGAGQPEQISPSDQFDVVKSADQPEKTPLPGQLDVVGSIELPVETAGSSVRDGTMEEAKKAQTTQASGIEPVRETINATRLERCRMFVLLLHDAIQSTEPVWKVEMLSARVEGVMRKSGWHMHLLFTASSLWVGLQVILVDECKLAGLLPIRGTELTFSNSEEWCEPKSPAVECFRRCCQIARVGRSSVLLVQKCAMPR